MLGVYPGIYQGPRSRLGEEEDEEGEDSVEEEGYEENEGEASLESGSDTPGAPNLVLSNQPLGSQDEQHFLKIMEKMTQFMGQLTQEVSPRDNETAQEFKTPYMNAPDSFDGTKAHKLRGFIQSCQLIFRNDP
ncbi:hypothetical protein O181_017843 [Austropuccinia psidii MF-1]|uniref:Uncharacterized protein n=1 Tax=Austropuccinia psidii MF-1 TaxID=1389203 RepID=A0A9Q3C6U8_9BASI|nr:hypothetical protein [Austropuccinia psidii MF-1]